MQTKKIPTGLRVKFNLCQDINNENLVVRISKILEQASSRILETLEENCNEVIENLETDFEKLKEE